MARIPLQPARRSLETGNIIQYPQGGGPVGDAVSGFGRVLDSVADRYTAMKVREDAFDAQVIEQELQNDLDRMDMEAVENAAADGSNLHDTVYGERDPETDIVRKPGAFDSIFDRAASRIPASQRQRFLEKKEALRGQRSTRMAGVQLDRRRSYEKVHLGEKRQDLLNRIMQTDPDDVDAYNAIVKEYEEMVGVSGQDALVKEADVLAMKEEAAKALAQAVKQRDPAALKRMLGLPEDPALAGAGVAASGGVNGIVNRIIGAESGGRASAKNPKSSASGLGQFTDGTWLATIAKHRPDLRRTLSDRQLLALKNDPKLGREMTTRLTEDNMAFLRGIGVEPTPGNTYLAHFLGTGGAGSVLRERDEVRLENVVGAGVVRANPFLAGKTVGWIKQWAARKMGGPAPVGGFTPMEIDPRFEALPYEDRVALGNQADAAIREQMALLRGSLESVITNAPAAIQQTGSYDGVLPSQEQFVAAYGAQDGIQRFQAFDTAVQTAQQVHSMQTMPAAGIAAMVEAAVPTSSGDMAALEGKSYEVIQSAAAETMRARKEDPAAYVTRAFPQIGQLAKAAAAGGVEAQQAYITASIAAQKQLGIADADIQPLTAPIAKSAADSWKNDGAPQQARVERAVSLMAGTTDPTQRNAIFEQLVEAGIPDMSRAAFTALERGDRGAADRLFQAALTDPSEIAGKQDATPAKVDDMIQNELMGDGMVGEIYYGIRAGSTENVMKAQRDNKLMHNAIRLRMVTRGESLRDATRGVGQDIFGKVQVLTGDSRVNVTALVGEDEDADAYRNGLAVQMPQVRRDVLALGVVPDEANMADGSLVVAKSVIENYADLVLADGYFTQSGDGFVFMDPFTFLPVAAADGRPIVYRPDLTAAAAATTPRQPRVFGGSEPPPAQPYAQQSGQPVAQPSIGLGSLPAGAALPDPLAPPAAPARVEMPETPTLPGDVPAFSQRLIDDAAARQGVFTGGAGGADRLTPSGSIPTSPGGR